MFLNGAVGDVLNGERVKAFNEDAKKGESFCRASL